MYIGETPAHPESAVIKVLKEARRSSVYPELLARRAGVSLSTVYRTRDMGLISANYFILDAGLVYRDLISAGERKGFLTAVDSTRKEEWGYIGDEELPLYIIREYWQKVQDPATGLADINPLLAYAFAHYGIKSNLDTLKQYVRYHVDGKGRLAYFILKEEYR